MSKKKTTVEIIGEAMERNKDMLSTPESAQTAYLANMVILLAALDDDLKRLIHVMEEEKK